MKINTPNQITTFESSLNCYLESENIPNRIEIPQESVDELKHLQHSECWKPIDLLRILSSHCKSDEQAWTILPLLITAHIQHLAQSDRISSKNDDPRSNIDTFQIWKDVENTGLFSNSSENNWILKSVFFLFLQEYLESDFAELTSGNAAIIACIDYHCSIHKLLPTDMSSRSAEAMDALNQLQKAHSDYEDSLLIYSNNASRIGRGKIVCATRLKPLLKNYAETKMRELIVARQHNLVFNSDDPVTREVLDILESQIMEEQVRLMNECEKNLNQIGSFEESADKRIVELGHHEFELEKQKQTKRAIKNNKEYKRWITKLWKLVWMDLNDVSDKLEGFHITAKKWIINTREWLQTLDWQLIRQGCNASNNGLFVYDISTVKDMYFEGVDIMESAGKTLNQLQYPSTNSIDELSTSIQKHIADFEENSIMLTAKISNQLIEPFVLYEGVGHPASAFSISGQRLMEIAKDETEISKEANILIHCTNQMQEAINLQASQIEDYLKNNNEDI